MAVRRSDIGWRDASTILCAAVIIGLTATLLVGCGKPAPQPEGKITIPVKEIISLNVAAEGQYPLGAFDIEGVFLKKGYDLTVNGHKALDAGRTEDGKKKFKVTLTLLKGANRITLVLTDMEGKKAQEVFGVTAVSTAPEKPTTTSPPPPTASGTSSPEYMCASIQKGYEVEPSDPLVSLFASTFDALQTTFPGRSRVEISDVICAAKQRIDTTTTAKKTLLQVAQEINASVPLEARGAVTLKETTAAYVTLLRQYGQ